MKIQRGGVTEDSNEDKDPEIGAGDEKNNTESEENNEQDEQSDQDIDNKNDTNLEDDSKEDTDNEISGDVDEPDEDSNSVEENSSSVLSINVLGKRAPANNEIESTGGFTVAGGIYGEDYEYKTVTVSIQGYGNMENIQLTPGGSMIASWTLVNTQNSLEGCYPYALTRDIIDRYKSGNVETISYNALVIKTDTPLTITTNGQETSDCIYIEKGNHANLTFDNVVINGRIPVNIATNKLDGDYVSDPGDPKNSVAGNPEKYIVDNNPTSLNLILAKGSTNTLSALRDNKKYQFPAIRCGEGSRLTIDDDRINIDKNNVAVLPEQGRISRDAVLKDDTTIKKGDRLTKLDSDNPGKLNANGGFHAACIGGSSMENSGEITINGGIITTSPYKPATSDVNDVENYYSDGAGIGGGHGGGGTTMTFNGGEIYAKGSFHGAGIGAGSTYIFNFSTYPSYALTDSIIDTYILSPIAGDIYINGGYLEAIGYEHGNAFGQGCAGSNTGRKIIITGGTLLPDSQKPQIKTYDIGGGGGDVIVTGGSVRISDASKYQSKTGNGTAWGDLEMTTPVVMRKIDLSGYAKAGTSLAKTLVKSIDMSVNNIPVNYGLPSYTDDQACLYFWLPLKGNAEVRVDLGVINPQDSEKESIYPLQSFYITENQSGDLLKQWSSFTIDPNKISEANRLKKSYDGKPFTQEQINSFLLDLLSDDGVSVDNPEGGKLKDASKINPLTSQKVDDNGNPVIGAEEKNTVDQSGVGKYELVISSTEYANADNFKNSFWGHRGYYRYAEITPVDSIVSTDITRQNSNNNQSTNKIVFNSIVRPADEDADTCASPLGKVEYYAVLDDGTQVKVAESDLSPAKNENNELIKTTASNGKTFYYSTASASWTPSSGTAYKRNNDDTYKIISKYIPGSDPDDKSNAINYNPTTLETANVEITPVNQNFVVDEKTSDITNRIIPEDKDHADREFTFGDHGETGENSTLQLIPSTDNNTLPSSTNPYVFTSSDPKIAEIDSQGNVTFKTDGTVTFTITQEGNAAYNPVKKTVTYKINPKIIDYQDLRVTKTARRSKSGPIQVGEMIVYQIGVTNNIPGSTITPVVIRDKLPDGLSLATSAFTIRHSDGSVENVANEDMYDSTTRYITKNLGTLTYGQSYVITIRTIVDKTSYTDENGEHKYNFGNTVDYGPGENAEGKDEYPQHYGPVYPDNSGPITSDPDEPLKIEKGCEEEEDGKLIYNMRVQNRDIVPWYNVSFRDVLPQEITLVENSLTIQEPGKKARPLDQSKYYDEGTRTIDYPIGTLNPGDVYIISFECNVASDYTEPEKKQTITNVGSVTTDYGQLDTPPVHPGESQGASGNPSGISIAKSAAYDESNPDEIVYTLTLRNHSGEDASSVQIRDVLPEPLTLKSGSAFVHKPDGTTEYLSDGSIYNAETHTVTYSLPASVFKSGEVYVLTFAALITGDESLKTSAEVEERLKEKNISGIGRISDIRNSGSASGTWSNGGGGGGWSASSGSVSIGGSSSGTTNGGAGGSGNNDAVTERPDMYITKSAVNFTHGSGELHVGDRIGYTIEAGNEAVGNNTNAINSNTILTDYLPIGLDADFDTMQLIVPDGRGQKSISPLTKVGALGNTVGTYSLEDGTVTRNGKSVAVKVMKVYAGDLKPGEKAFLYFNARVTDKVTDIGNSAGLNNETPLDPVYPGDPDKKTPDPEEETPVVTKTAAPRPKAIEYSVHIKNPTRRSTWRNVQLFDYLPPQLEIVEDSIRIQKYEGGAKVQDFAPSKDTYNEQTHILTYPISRLRPGEEYVLSYYAIARSDGSSKPIENRAGYTGEDPNGKKTEGSALSVRPQPVPNTGDAVNEGHWIAMLVSSLSIAAFASIVLIKWRKA